MIPLTLALQGHDLQKLSVENSHDLVVMHVPYNFGHTVEITRILPPAMLDMVFSMSPEEGVHGGSVNDKVDLAVPMVKQFAKPDSDLWGHFNPDLLMASEVTGCGLYYTPQKYWPRDIAEQYFGNKTVFGLLRDPYERLIAYFRGEFSDYGGSFPELFKTCDVNGAVKKMMRMAINSTNPFMNGCTFIPQAEYFEGRYGITLPIDNRRFPTSMNEAFAAHGYTEHIKTQNIGHVTGCNNMWAGDLDAETKQLVRQVYAKDFELLCKHFNYCDSEENVCLQQVEHMCPTKLFHWDPEQMQFIRNA